VTFTSLPLLVAMLALPPGGSDPALQGDPALPGGAAPQEEAAQAAAGVLIRVVLIDLATLLDPGEPAPATPAEAMDRLQAAGMAVPAGLAPDRPLRKSDAVQLAAAVGLNLTAGRPADAVLPSGLAHPLVRMLHTALSRAQESSE
jgi:hypothetical protein